jgi:hypothetical protein
MVWSSITHSMFSAGSLPFFSYCLKSRWKMSARYWSGMFVWKFG